MTPRKRQLNPELVEMISQSSGRTKCAMLGWYALALGHTETGIAAYSIVADPEDPDCRRLLRRPDVYQMMIYLAGVINKAKADGEWNHTWDEKMD